MFGVLHFLNHPGHPAALDVNGEGYGYAGSLASARVEFKWRVRTGTARFIALGNVEPETGRARDSAYVTPAVPRVGSTMVLYPVFVRDWVSLGKRYSLAAPMTPVYTLTLGDDNVITVTDHQREYVCSGCRGDVKYTRNGWVHLDRTPIRDTCRHTGIDGNPHRAYPMERATAEWAQRTRAARRAVLAANGLNW